MFGYLNCKINLCQFHLVQNVIYRKDNITLFEKAKLEEVYLTHKHNEIIVQSELLYFCDLGYLSYKKVPKKGPK